MRLNSSLKIFPIFLITCSAAAAITSAPSAPDQPDVSQDGLIAKIRWTSQVANTDAFVSQSVNGLTDPHKPLNDINHLAH